MKRSIWRQPTFLIGFVLFAPVIAIAVAGYLLAPHDPIAYVASPFSGPSEGVRFGTDNLGRDVFSRFLAGGMWLVVFSLSATAIGVTLGALAGSALAVVGGRIDDWVMRLADSVLAFPPIIVALMLLALFGPQGWVIVGVIAIGHMPRTMRVVRAAAQSVVARDFVRYGETLGTPLPRVVVADVLPNIAGPLMVEYGIRLTYSLGLIAGLSFLGLGVQPPLPDWGNMINENRLAFVIQPWGVLLPLAALAMLTIGISLMTDGLSRWIGNIETGGRGG